MWPFRRKHKAPPRPVPADPPPDPQAEAEPTHAAADVPRELEHSPRPEPGAAAPVDPLLGRFLLAEGPLTREQIQRQLAVAGKADTHIGQVLAQLPAPREAELFAVLAPASRVPELDLKKCRVQVSAAHSIARGVALRYKTIPISRIGDLLCVVFAGEPNPKALEAIRRATGLLVKAFRCPEHHIHILLRRLYPPTRAAVPAVPISQQEHDGVVRTGASQAEARWDHRHTTQGPIRAARLARR